MRLQDQLPKGVFVHNKFYRLDFDFRNVLRMMEIMDRDDLMPEAKEYLALKCLTKHPRNVHSVLLEVRKLLFQERPNKDAKKVTDFEQDAGLIRAAFKQEFGVDLYRDKLHWIEFSEMLNAIPQGNRYAEVVGIRVRPIPAPTKWNQHERDWLIKAKADVALHLSDKEQEEKYQEDVGKVFAAFFGMIQKGSENQDGK